MSAQRWRYASDLTDEEWPLLAPLLPSEKPGGRPRKYPRRDVSDGIQYVLCGGCAWRLMPHDLPDWQTAYQTLRAWGRDGTWRRLHDRLREGGPHAYGAPPPTLGGHHRCANGDDH